MNNEGGKMDQGNQQPQTSSGLRLGVTIVLVIVSAIVFGLIGWWAGKQQATTDTTCPTLPTVLPPVPSVPEEESSATETPATSATVTVTATATSTT